MASREAIFSKLFALVGAAATTAGARTTSRRFKLWDQVAAGAQPALFQTQLKDSIVSKKGFPNIRQMNAQLVVYVNQGSDPAIVPSTALNAIIDAVESALAPDPATGFQQLLDASNRPQVQNCVFSDVEITEGLVDTTSDQSVAVMGVKIEALATDVRPFAFDSGLLMMQIPGTPDNWIKVGVLENVLVEVTFKKTPIRQGKYQVTTGHALEALDVNCKASFARMDGNLISRHVFGGTPTSGATLIDRDRFYTIPSSGPYTVSVVPPSSGAFGIDLGVEDDVTGSSLIRVSSAPAAGQYSLSGSTYTFSSSDAGKVVVMCYTYSISGGTKLAIGNPIAGSMAPKFKAILSTAFNSSQSNWIFNASISDRFLFATKLEEFTVPEMQFSAVADASNNLGEIHFSS